MEMIKLATLLLTLVLVPAVHPKALYRQVREIQTEVIKETTPSSNDSQSTINPTQAVTNAVPVTSAALHDHRFNESEPVVTTDDTAASAVLLHHRPDHLTNDSSTTEAAQNATKQLVEKQTTEGVAISTAAKEEPDSGKPGTTLKSAEGEVKSEAVETSTAVLVTKEKAVEFKGTKGDVAETSTAAASKQ